MCVWAGGGRVGEESEREREREGEGTWKDVWRVETERPDRPLQSVAIRLTLIN